MHKLTSDRMRWGQLAFLIGLVLAGGLLLRQSWPASDFRSWVPIDVPLPLAGQSIREEFVTGLKAVYVVQVELRPSPVDFRSDLTGPELDRLGQELDRLEPDLDWSVTRNGQTVSRNQPNVWEGGQTFRFVSGEFEASPGQRYTIRAQVRRSVPRLQMFHPHLQITAVGQKRYLQSRQQRFARLGLCLMLPAILLLVALGHKSVSKRCLM